VRKQTFVFEDYFIFDFLTFFPTRNWNWPERRVDESSDGQTLRQIHL